MRKIMQSLLVCLTITGVFWTMSLLSDREQLNEELIRLHVIANSDSEHDQFIKMKVRDAVLESLREGLQSVSDIEEAKSYIRESIPKIEKIANATLSRLGFEGKAVASLEKEAYETRHYDTFSLPAGIYESLRIIIGEGAGKNWWCVAFPTLCVPATTEGFAEIAAGAGFSTELTDTLTGKEDCKVRFFLLDKLGQLQNRLCLE